MPDALRILGAQAIAAVIAAVLLLACGWPWRASKIARTAVGSLLGAAIGFCAGCKWLVLLPFGWPPTKDLAQLLSEDLGRLFLLLLPATVIIELVAIFLARWPWVVWGLRLVLAASAGRILLHGSAFLTETDTPESVASQPWLTLCAMAAALAAVWSALVVLMRTRKCSRSVLASLAIVCGGASVTVMFSFFVGGGQLGLPLAAALAGVFAASWALSGEIDLEGVIGLGVMGLFGLLVSGHFFNELTWTNALLLFLAPLLCWLPETPYLQRLGPKVRGVIRVVLTAAPVVAAVLLARANYNAKPESAPAGINEPSIEDYEAYSK